MAIGWSSNATIRRKKTPKGQNFSRVLNLEYKKEGEVDQFLDTQFTVNYDDGTYGFLFYKEEGATWKPLDEGAIKQSGNSDFIQFIMDELPPDTVTTMTFDTYFTKVAGDTS